MIGYAAQQENSPNLREFLKTVGSNINLKDKNVRFEYKKPYDAVAAPQGCVRARVGMLARGGALLGRARTILRSRLLRPPPASSQWRAREKAPRKRVDRGSKFELQRLHSANFAEGKIDPEAMQAIRRIGGLPIAEGPCVFS